MFFASSNAVQVVPQSVPDCHALISLRFNTSFCRPHEASNIRRAVVEHIHREATGSHRYLCAKRPPVRYWTILAAAFDSRAIETAARIICWQTEIKDNFLGSCSSSALASLGHKRTEIGWLFFNARVISSLRNNRKCRCVSFLGSGRAIGYDFVANEAARFQVGCFLLLHNNCLIKLFQI